MYGVVREGGRARDFEEAIEWLVSAGMLNRVYNISKMEHPLSAFDKLDQFKLFVFDTGLLKRMAGIDNSVILLKTDYQFKGPLTENFAAFAFAHAMVFHCNSSDRALNCYASLDKLIPMTHMGAACP